MRRVAGEAAWWGLRVNEEVAALWGWRPFKRWWIETMKSFTESNGNRFSH